MGYFPDDDSTLEDFWVFTDLWKRMGMDHPEDPGDHAIALEVGEDFGDKLSTISDDDL